MLASRVPVVAFALVLACCAGPTTPTHERVGLRPAERSLAYAERLLAVDARFEPEDAGELGALGLDESIYDLTSGSDERAMRAYAEIETALRAAIATETDPSVQIDLGLLAEAAADRYRDIELQRKYCVADIEVAKRIADGVRALLDEQVPAARHGAALVRLRKYAGLPPGTVPIVELAEARARERLARCSTPFILQARVDRYLLGWRSSLAGLRPELERLGVLGADEPLSTLVRQLEGYEAFLRRELLPRAQSDLRRPEELYAFALTHVGIDMPARELAALARAEFTKTQAELQGAAVDVAARLGLASHDYRDVLRALKAHQVEGEDLVALYEKRIRDIEGILVEHSVVSLPKRALRFRLATEAESEGIPAPFYKAPPLLQNHGEEGTFVLPRHGGQAGRFDDFSSDASSWWLTAHEGRPGHDLQYSRMIESNVTLARAHFAFNSANAEGWGLYAESLVLPYAPLEGRLAILQARLMREAHAFLDPELNLGMITADEARRVMTDDVVFSPAWAASSVQRYSVWWPGQAPSYFYGYTRLVQLHHDAQSAWGAQFSERRFNDAVLAQGFLPYPLLRRALLGRP